MISLAILVFFVLDGVLRGNLAPEAAPWRAGMMALVVIAWLIALWRAGVRVPAGCAVLGGILLSQAIAETYYRATGGGMGTYIIYGLVYFGQRALQRDWRDDFAVVAVVIAFMVLLALPEDIMSDHSMPYNRNMVAAFLVVLLPAALDRWKAVGLAVLVAIFLTGSRGGMIAGTVTMLVMVAHHVRIPRRAAAWSVPAGGAVLAGLVAIRPRTLATRVVCASSVLRAWWQTSPMFGLGPGFEIGPVPLLGPLGNAHSFPLTLVAIGGLAGVVIISLALMLARRSSTHTAWQAASIAGALTHALIEENLTWWPVGFVIAIAAAGYSGVYDD